jgi:hypothetical protein
MALAGTTVFGVISVVQIAVLVYVYIDIYQSPPPPFPTRSYHQFPIHSLLNRDLRNVAPIIFAFICCLILYVQLPNPEKENSK